MSLCKGAWILGTACGECERCLRTAPAEIARLRAERDARWDKELVEERWLIQNRRRGDAVQPRDRLVLAAEGAARDTIVLGESAMTCNQKCFKCGAWLLSEIEIDTNCCETCADRLYEQDRERREWDYYHPPEQEDSK